MVIIIIQENGLEHVVSRCRPFCESLNNLDIFFSTHESHHNKQPEKDLYTYVKQLTAVAVN